MRPNPKTRLVTARHLRNQAKLLRKSLLEIMKRRKISQAEIARRLRLPMQIVNRTLNEPSPTLAAVTAVAYALGYELKLSLKPSGPSKRKPKRRK